MTVTTYSTIELESVAAEYIGKIVFKLSELESNLNLCLRWTVKAQDLNTVNPLVERLSFKSKIDALIDIIEIKFNPNLECISDFKSWHRKLDKFRVKRNYFIHGRWEFLNKDQPIVNSAQGMNGSNKHKETHYELSELKQELLSIERISEEFYALRRKWHI